MESQKESLTKELTEFLKSLRKFYYLYNRVRQKEANGVRVFGKEMVELSELQQKLQHQYGTLEHVIESLSGLDRTSLPFESALATSVKVSIRESSLTNSIDLLRKVIGKLSSLSEEQISQLLGREEAIKEPPKAFIAHGGQSAALRKLCSFLEALGVKPLVAELQPSKGRLTETQVEEYMRQADCEIILATYGHIEDTKTGQKHPRLNVIDELGRARAKFPGRIILLLQRGVELPSNVSGIVYEHFTKQNVEQTFIKVARELRAFGLIEARHPD